MPRIMSAAFSAIITVAACVFELTMRGMIEQSTTRSPSIPCTLSWGDTTEDSDTPMAQVPAWWYDVRPCSRTYRMWSASVLRFRSPASSSFLTSRAIDR